MESMREYGDSLPYGVISLLGLQERNKESAGNRYEQRKYFEKCLFCTSHIIHLLRIFL